MPARNPIQARRKWHLGFQQVGENDRVDVSVFSQLVANALHDLHEGVHIHAPGGRVHRVAEGAHRRVPVLCEITLREYFVAILLEIGRHHAINTRGFFFQIAARRWPQIDVGNDDGLHRRLVEALLIYFVGEHRGVIGGAAAGGKAEHQ